MLSLISFSSYSQSAPPVTKGKITGKVIDAAENAPLEFATISIFSNDSALIDGGITDSGGEFQFNLNPGNYYVEVQFVSYQKRTINNINIENRRTSVDLGSIRLQPATTNLNEVTVRGEKSEMVIGVDRKIFNVGKDLSNTGNSAAEILDNIPTVAVDAEGNISLRGSGGVRMLIDGKPSGLVNSGSANALQALQGNMIERVEVITNPSARYEAAGMVGIINIVLKKDERRGVNGSFETSVAYPERYQFGANINFRREKINYFFKKPLFIHASTATVNAKDSPTTCGVEPTFSSIAPPHLLLRECSITIRIRTIPMLFTRTSTTTMEHRALCLNAPADTMKKLRQNGTWNSHRNP
jgi:hypothetical protein